MKRTILFRRFLFSLMLIGVIFITPRAYAQVNKEASYSLIKRVIPQRATSFVIEQLKTDGKDVFEIESKGNKIILRGNNGVAVASALYYYLNEYCHCQVTWNGTNLNLAQKLPQVTHKIHKLTPYIYRYYLNYCRKDFLLGPWLADARRQSSNPAEQDLYEKNARDLITLWGDANSPLHEYSCRQCSGLLNDFYKVRWEKFFAELDAALKQGKEADLKAFNNAIKEWEWQWVNSHKVYPVNVLGSSVTGAMAIYQKYRKIIGAAYEQ